MMLLLSNRCWYKIAVIVLVVQLGVPVWRR